MTFKLLKENGFEKRVQNSTPAGSKNSCSAGGVMSKTTWKSEVQLESTYVELNFVLGCISIAHLDVKMQIWRHYFPNALSVTSAVPGDRPV
jgi:hypothetical protein